MSVQRRGTGDAVSPKRRKHSDISELLRTYFDVPGNTESINLPDCGASGGTDFVQNEIPWGTSPGVVTEDLFEMDLTETDMLEAPSPNCSCVCSGLDYSSTSKAGSSTDPEAGGATGSHYVPLQRELVPSRIKNDQIRISLLNEEHWNFLHQHDNEMLIRYTGCYLSPPLQFTISGLDRIKLYSLFLEFPTRDDYFWIYQNNTWIKAGTSEEQKTVPFVEHPRSPSPGNYWMTCNEIGFNNVKLCSCPVTDDLNKVSLNIFQAYVPQISLMEVDESSEPIMETLLGVLFPETAFIAVASYQNPQVQKLKSKGKTKVKSSNT